MTSKLRALWNSISTWGWPAKFLAGATISAFAGGGVLSFLLQNAAYSFALTYGFRPPVEGIPYLAPLVTFASIALLLLAAILALTITVMVKHLVIRLLEWSDSKEAGLSGTPTFLSAVRSLPPWKALPAIGAFSAITFTFHEFLLPTGLFYPLEICAWPLLLCLPDDGQGGQFVSIVLGSFVSTMIGLMIWRPTLVWIGTFVIVALYYFWIAAAVLPADGYGRLLRMTGFGGGIQVTIHFDEKAGAASRPIEAYLLMRSSTHTFVYSPEESRIREYPLSSILQISHRQGGLHSLRSLLPPTTSLMHR